MEYILCRKIFSDETDRIPQPKDAQPHGDFGFIHSTWTANRLMYGFCGKRLLVINQFQTGVDLRLRHSHRTHDAYSIIPPS
jgi:hypothetical protein